MAFIEALLWWAGGRSSWAAATHDARVGWRAGDTIEPEAVEALFEPRRPGEGVGKIGLFVVRGLADAQGGSAWGSVEDGRLILRLRLPLAT